MRFRIHLRLVRLFTLLLAALFVGLTVAYLRMIQPHPTATTKAQPPPLWPIFRGDQRLSGSASGTLSTNLQLRWSFAVGDALKSSPVLGHGCAYIGADNGTVYALSIDAGTQVWLFVAGAAIEAPPVLIGDLLVVGALDGVVYALDARNGAPRWRAATDGKIVGSANWAATDDGRTLILVGSYDNCMYAFDTATGARVWRFKTGNYINGAPAVANGMVVFGGCDAQLRALCVTSGVELASVDADAYVAASAALAGDRAFVGNYNGKLICVDLVSANIVWEYENPDRAAPFFSCPAVADDRVVVGGRDKRVHCINRRDGAGIWRFQTRGNVDGSPVVCDRRVVVGSDDGWLYMLDAMTGLPCWQYEVGAAISSAPAVAGGLIVVAAEDGRVYAFGPRK